MDLTYLMLTGSLSGLVSVLVHSILASARAAVRPGALVPPLQERSHIPPLHTSFGLQAMSHEPQWPASLSVSTHTPSQSVVPPSHEGTQLPPGLIRKYAVAADGELVVDSSRSRDGLVLTRRLTYQSSFLPNA